MIYDFITVIAVVLNNDCDATKRMSLGDPTAVFDCQSY